MRLASAEVIPYALPFKEPYVTARGRLEQREMVLLRLRSEEGLVGLGEAVPLSMRGGAGLAEVVDELEALSTSDVLRTTVERHRQDEPSEVGEALAGDPALSAPAKCAALTAVLDLCERRDFAGCRPPSDGSRPRSSIGFERHDPGPIPCNATLVAGEPAAVAEDALRWAAEGYATFKLKLGTGRDVEQVQAVREAVGEEARIRLDANAAWSLETAKRTLAELEPLDIELVEQPVEQVEDAARLAWETFIPLAADEGVASRDEAEQALLLGAYRLTGIKLSKVGGITEGRCIANLIHSYVSSALDGPVGIAAGARLAQQIHYEGANPFAPRFAHGLATQRLFASTIASVACELRDGMLHLPPGPGLGVEIDEKALAAHRI
jgi:L-alanine-DL-glutamate epimerase-like enolase superfamily enzyme